MLLLASCERDMNGTSSSTRRLGSSLTIVGDYLYAVDNHFLYSYDIISNDQPSWKHIFHPVWHWNYLSIYSTGLFIGAALGCIFAGYAFSINLKWGELALPRLRPAIVRWFHSFVTARLVLPAFTMTAPILRSGNQNVAPLLLIKDPLDSNPLRIVARNSPLHCCNNDGLGGKDVFRSSTPRVY
jgi:hypothetical protein